MSQPENRDDTVAALLGVTKVFESARIVRALSDVSFEVRKGEIFGLLGPKDSGKSTTLKLLAGCLGPSEGKVRVFGRSPKRRRVKACTGYLADVSVRLQSSLLLNLLGLFQRIVGIAPPPSQVGVRPPSPAQYRAALATVLLKNPDLVLLDNPFLGSDPLLVNEVKELIRNLARRGKTIVFTSNCIMDAFELCDRMAVFYEGRVQAVGTLSQLLAHPDCIRFLAPLLTPSITARVLELISAELATPFSIWPNQLDLIPSSHLSTDRAILLQPTSEQILGPLLKTPAPEKPAEPPPQDATPINHGKLAALTKPSPGS